MQTIRNHGIGQSTFAVWATLVALAFQIPVAAGQDDLPQAANASVDRFGRGGLRKWPNGLCDVVRQGDVSAFKTYLDRDPGLLADRFSFTGQLGGKPIRSDGWTLLHLAVNDGQLGIVEELLRRGADVNAQAVGRGDQHPMETPLHVAACRAHIIPILLQHGADIDARDQNENTPLRLAVLRGSRRAAGILARAGATQDVFCAAGMGNVTLLELLLDQDPAMANERMADGFTPLHCAAATGELATARLLLTRGAAIDPQTSNVWGGAGTTPLHEASMRGHVSMCGLLIDSGADLELPGIIGPPLHWAVFDGDLQLAAFLIARGANVSSRAPHDDKTPLHTAAQYGWIEMADLLIRNGADVNAEGGYLHNVPNAEGNDAKRPNPTPLDKAIESHKSDSQKSEMVRFLLSKKARLGRCTEEQLAKLLEPSGATKNQTHHQR